MGISAKTKYFRISVALIPRWARLLVCCYSVFKDRAQAFVNNENPAVRMPRRVGEDSRTRSGCQPLNLFFYLFTHSYFLL